MKNEVDINNFLTYTQFNNLYAESLDKLELYAAQIRQAIDAVDDFCITMKAIVPDDNMRLS